MKMKKQLKPIRALKTNQVKAFGSIHHAILKLTGVNRTIQIQYKKQGIDLNEIKPLIQHELKLLKSLNDPNLLKVYDLFETSTELIIINNYTEGKELFDTIYKIK